MARAYFKGEAAERNAWRVEAAPIGGGPTREVPFVMRGQPKNRTSCARHALTVGALGLSLTAPVALGGGGTTHQVLVGQPFNANDIARGVIELPDSQHLLTVGEQLVFDKVFNRYQLVTRHDEFSFALWSFFYDWETDVQRALEAVEQVNTNEFAVVGISVPNVLALGGGPNPNNRLTLMTLDDQGGIVWANRYPGGSLPPGQGLFLSGLEAQAAVELATLPLAADLGGPISRSPLAIATLSRTGPADPLEGQFMRVDQNGSVVSFVRYREPAAFQRNLFALYDLELDPSTSGYAMTGMAMRLEEGMGGEIVSPILMFVDFLGSPEAAYLLPLLAPNPNAFVNRSGGTSVLRGLDGKVYMAGFTDYFNPAIPQDGGFVTCIDTSGKAPTVSWTRVIGDFSPALRSLSLNEQGELALVGEALGGGRNGPTLVVLDEATGSVLSSTLYEPSGSGQANDAIALVAGGWHIAGSGRSSGFTSQPPVATDSRGGPSENDTQILMIRTDTSALSGCHEREIKLMSELIDIALVPFEPEFTAFKVNGIAEQVFSQEIETVFEDDCANVPCECPGDADGNLFVNFADVTAVLNEWLDIFPLGETGRGDADCNSIVNFADITIILNRWLDNCAP